MQATEPQVFLFFRAVTEIGDSKWTLVPTGVLGFCCFSLDDMGFPATVSPLCSIWLASAFFFVFVSVALSGIVANVIKVIVGRGRPKLLDQTGLTGFEPFTLDGTFHSFPSGHTNTAFALAIAISLLIPRWRGGLLAFASVVGFSRIVVNAHFLTDVIGGAALAVPTTWWLRQRFAAHGLVFTKGEVGEYALRWPGRLIPVMADRFFRNGVPTVAASR